MKAFVAILSLLAIASAANWAVLAAGSEGFGNYRHQADIAHAYQIVKRGGFDEDKIITMMYNDVPTDPRNPFPGELYNRPGDDAKDVYKGVVVDYEGKDVSAVNFCKVLMGDESAGGKVLKSTEEDNIFIFFSDHGGQDLLAFPGGYLYSKELYEALDYMFVHKMYKKLVIYVEACYAGSMFLTLPTDRNILAYTAANDKESSWGWYCGAEAKVKGVLIGSCLGDEFSVRWMEDTDLGNQLTETLEDQFQYLVKAVTKSHVSRYGDLSFTSDVIAEFVGAGGPGSGKSESSVAWDSRDNDLLFAKFMYDTYKTDEYHQLYLEQLSLRQQIDRYFYSLRQEDRFYVPLGHSVTNFDCYKRAVNQFESLFGHVDYGFKYFNVYAHMCEENAEAF